MIQYSMKDDDPDKIIKKEKKGNKLAQNLDPGNYYRRKSKMDADADMIGDDFKGDGKKIKLYAENAADHFEWIKSLGVSYKEASHLGRIVVPESNESLLYTGNERVAPFCTLAKPIPRGHVPVSYTHLTLPTILLV